LAAQVSDAFNSAAGPGPAAPRPDRNPDTELTRLRTWVDAVLIPGYVLGGGYSLAECWDQHPHAVWELATIAAQWRRIYERPRPPLAAALEWHDRWLPGAMRRVAHATRRCQVRHTLDLGR
jgi:hypothetical protein